MAGHHVGDRPCRQPLKWNTYTSAPSAISAISVAIVQSNTSDAICAIVLISFTPFTWTRQHPRNGWTALRRFRPS
jgi:hypothetical protein